MIRLIEGNIFNSNTDAIVNTINCVGAMGKGLALEFKKKYPNMYEKYKVLCKNKRLNIGQFFIYKADKLIVNFPTKYDWRKPSEYEYIIKGLKHFVEIYKNLNIKSIAFPLLGCRNGGLDNYNVICLMKHYLGELNDIDIEIYVDSIEDIRQKSLKDFSNELPFGDPYF